MATTITITCPECNKQFKAPPEVVGRKIRCKGCEQIFVAKADPPGKGGKPGKQAAPSQHVTEGPTAKPPRNADEDDDDGDGKPYGVTDLDLKPRCPHCANEMESEEAVLCLHCGFNVQTRRHAETRKVKDVTGGDVFAWLLPGILSAVGFFAIMGGWAGAIAYWATYEVPSSEENRRFYLNCCNCFAIWTSVFSLYGLYKTGRFAITRLLINNKPPEEEVS